MGRRSVAAFGVGVDDLAIQRQRRLGLTSSRIESGQTGLRVEERRRARIISSDKRHRFRVPLLCTGAVASLLGDVGKAAEELSPHPHGGGQDRKSVVEGKSVSVGV